MSGASGLISPTSACFAPVALARFLTRLRKNSCPVPEIASMSCSSARSRKVRWESTEGEAAAVAARLGALLLDDCTKPLDTAETGSTGCFLDRREGAGGERLNLLS